MTLSKQRSHDCFPKSQDISPCMLAIFQLGKLPSASLNPPCGFNWIQASSLSCRNCCAGLLCAVKQLLSEVGDRIDPGGAGVSAARGQERRLPKHRHSWGHTRPQTGLCSQTCPPRALFPGLAPCSAHFALQNHNLHTPRWILLHFPACQLPGRAPAAGASMCSCTWRTRALLTGMWRHRIPLPLASPHVFAE